MLADWDYVSYLLCIKSIDIMAFLFSICKCCKHPEKKKALLMENLIIHDFILTDWPDGQAFLQLKPRNTRYNRKCFNSKVSFKRGRSGKERSRPLKFQK